MRLRNPFRRKKSFKAGDLVRITRSQYGLEPNTTLRVVYSFSEGEYICVYKMTAGPRERIHYDVESQYLESV